jgi:lipopolysaccharide transport system ATP-binding protein
MGRMQQIGKEGRTILFVSHNIAALQTLCTRGILLSEGKVAVDGGVHEVVDYYLQSMAGAAAKNIAERTDRRGFGPCRLTNVQISTDGNSSQGELGRLVAGLPARFEFEVNQPHHGIACIFTIYDHNGQPVSSFSTGVQTTEDELVAMPGRFICDLDELLLVPGTYRLNVAIEAGQTLHDHLEGAAIFEVEDGMIRGRPARNRFARVNIPHTWTTQDFAENSTTTSNGVPGVKH